MNMLKVQICKLYNIKYIIASTQITNTEIFTSMYVVVLVVLHCGYSKICLFNTCLVIVQTSSTPNSPLSTLFSARCLRIFFCSSVFFLLPKLYTSFFLVHFLTCSLLSKYTSSHSSVVFSLMFSCSPSSSLPHLNTCFMVSSFV